MSYIRQLWCFDSQKFHFYVSVQLELLDFPKLKLSVVNYKLQRHNPCMIAALQTKTDLFGWNG